MSELTQGMEPKQKLEGPSVVEKRDAEDSERDRLEGAKAARGQSAEALVDAHGRRIKMAAMTGGLSLPGSVKGKLEAQLGADLGPVRVHTDIQAVADIGALAFTLGADIFFAPGNFRPDSAEGLALLAHEATHVVQSGARGHRTDGWAEVDQGGAHESEAEAIGLQTLRAEAGVEEAGDALGQPKISQSASADRVHRCSGCSTSKNLEPTDPRSEPNETRSFSALRSMTLGDFAAHQEAHLDWANTSKLDEAQRAKLWPVAHFAASESGVTACGEYKVGAIIKAMEADPLVLSALSWYAEARAHTRETVKLEEDAPGVGVALNWGKALQRLESEGPSGAILKQIFNHELFESTVGKKRYLEKQFGAGAVEMMRTLKRSLDPANILNPGKVVDV